MPLAQDRSLDLLASRPVCYHCTTDVPLAAVELYIMNDTLDMNNSVLDNDSAL